VKQALDALPATLDDTYTRVLLDIDDMYHDHALTLLRWLAYARSPPTLGELVDAAVTDPIHESSVDADNRGDLEDTLNILSGLVTVEESKDADVEGRSETKYSTTDVSIIDPDSADMGSHSRDPTLDTRVRLAHFSVKEYLESKRILKSRADQFYLESAIGHRVLAQSCLTYLRYYSASCEKTLTIQDLEAFPLLEYAAQSWFHHSALQCSGEASREISLLRIEQVRNDWLIVHDPDEPWNEPFVGRERRERRRGGSGSAIYYASLLGLPAVVTKLLYNGANVNVEGGHFGNPIQAALVKGHEGIVQLLIDKGANINAEGGSYGSPLQAALARGHEGIVQLLIDKGANINAEGGQDGSPIQAASPVQAASAEGHEGIVQLLIDSGANVTVEDREDGIPLVAASAKGDKNVV
jgi:hypothetical protein